MSLALRTFLSLILAIPTVSQSQSWDPDAFQPINAIRSIDEIYAGIESDMPHKAREFREALRQLSTVNKFPIRLDDGVTMFRVRRIMRTDKNETFTLEFLSPPCIKAEEMREKYQMQVRNQMHGSQWMGSSFAFFAIAANHSGCVETLWIHDLGKIESDDVAFESQNP